MCARGKRVNDLLRPVQRLATHLHQWDSKCDERLHRLVSCVNSTLHYRQIAWVDAKYGNLVALGRIRGDRPVDSGCCIQCKTIVNEAVRYDARPYTTNISCLARKQAL